MDQLVTKAMYLLELWVLMDMLPLNIYLQVCICMIELIWIVLCVFSLWDINIMLVSDIPKRSFNCKERCLQLWSCSLRNIDW